MRAELDRRAMALLSGGHLATDFANGALPALIPFLKERFSLSYTLVGTLILASQASSSLIQPLFGLWSDRRGGGLLLALPCLAAALGLVLVTPYLRSFAPDPSSPRARAGEDDRRAMGLLLGVIALRSVAWFGLISFVPLWEVSLGHSKAYGNHLLAAMLLMGGIGTLALGPLADRFGSRHVLLASVVATGPLILLFVLAGGVVGAIAVTLVGACVVGTFGVTMVMSQEYLPHTSGWRRVSRSDSPWGLGASPPSRSALSQTLRASARPCWSPLRRQSRDRARRPAPLGA